MRGESVGADVLREVSRKFSDRIAEMCNVDKEDHWKYYSEDVTADVQSILTWGLNAYQRTHPAPDVSAQSVDDELLFNGMTAQQFIGSELFEFQQATGCDNADQFRKGNFELLVALKANHQWHLGHDDSDELVRLVAAHALVARAESAKALQWLADEGRRLGLYSAEGGRLHAFLNAAAGDGLVCGDVDAEDLYRQIFHAQYAELASQIDTGTMLNGLTESETSATASMAGLSNMRCREELRLAGLAYPRSSCAYCGTLLRPGWKCGKITEKAGGQS